MAVMTPRDPVGRVVLRTVLIVVAVALALYLIYLLRRPITWLVIAAFIAVAVSGPVNLLQRRMRRGVAIALTYLMLILIPIGLGALLIPSLVDQIEELAANVPEYAQDV
jgi:predicted PurR-regulated permease PerM